MHPKKGTILISQPALNDLYFERSVVLLADHNEEGSYGLIINKPTNITLNEVTHDNFEFNPALYLGGPVNTDNLYILHAIGPEIKNSIEIVNGLYWGGNLDMLKASIHNNPKNKNKVRFYIGYSSWVTNQLNAEIEKHSWLIDKVNKKYIFNQGQKTTWSTLIKGFGEEYAIWANYPSNPILN